ncbi:MAG: hypothetical protein GY777_01650 [Candidatus Brocadiaceae bacterium]|nr:hypothetical protein [Candidatus Brocadiaceae bacterium]
MPDTIDWIYDLKPAILRFLSKLKDPDRPGFYSYSLTGDIYPSSLRWGLGNSVFAAKIYYMLDAVNGLSDCVEIADFINSFQSDSGEIFDYLVAKKSFPRRLLSSFREFDFNNIFNEQNRRAETRQAFAALRCLNCKPERPYNRVPYNREDIYRYITSLNWKQPWGAGSHISHLLFFLYNNCLLFNIHSEDTEDLINYSLDLVNKYRQQDGSWYLNGADLQLNYKVNAAMKIMTAYEAAGRDNFLYPEKLIDLCLASANDGDACNNFNIICVLYHCSRKTDHRLNEIRKYCLNKLETYKTYYWPEHGGFSFFQRNANSVYYGAKISRGLSEPDIHGTSLFLWGITLITKILKLNNNVKLNIPIT